MFHKSLVKITTKEYINVNKLIQESDSTLLKRLPSFIVSVIKSVIRQNEINRILTAYADYEGIDFLPKIISEFNISVEIEGRENLPENGRCFFVANHPFGFVDGLVLTNTVALRYGNFKAVGNELFALVPQLRSVVAAVNVFGASPREYLTELDKLFASDVPVTHFPSGTVSRVRRGKIDDGDWQKSFITKSIAHRRDIVPFCFNGRNSGLFYFIYLSRKALGIKTNLELVLLPHEIFNKRNKTIKVIIGMPIPYQTFNDSKTHFEWAQVVKKRVYGLKSPTGAGRASSPLS